MTAAELIQKFNLHYDNILSAAAPGLNEYEISLFFTQAHREIVLGYYNGVIGGNPIDMDENVKSLLSRYILTGTSPITQLSEYQIEGFKSYDVGLNSKVMRLLGERISNETAIRSSHTILVKPSNIDEIYNLINNPFRGPSTFRVLRLDTTSNNESSTRQVTLISKEDLVQSNSKYIYTFLKEPEPIILVNLNEDPWSSIGELTIMGEQEANIDNNLGNKISPSLWEMIINRAVELATRDYKENNLNTQIALNRRVE